MLQHRHVPLSFLIFVLNFPPCFSSSPSFSIPLLLADKAQQSTKHSQHERPSLMFALADVSGQRQRGRSGRGLPPVPPDGAWIASLGACFPSPGARFPHNGAWLPSLGARVASNGRRTYVGPSSPWPSPSSDRTSW